jgi:hypothetical protein
VPHAKFFLLIPQLLYLINVKTHLPNTSQDEKKEGMLPFGNWNWTVLS